MRVRLFIFIFIFLSSAVYAQPNCNRMLESLISSEKSIELGLTTKYSLKLKRLRDQSVNVHEFDVLLESLETSIFSKMGNLIKFRSKDIYEAFELLDNTNFQGGYFLNKLIKGEKLSLLEKRAFFLFTKKHFWFDSNLFKSQIAEIYNKFSLMRFFDSYLNKLDRVAMSSEFDGFFSKLNDENIFNKLFSKFEYEDNLKKQITSILHTSDKVKLKQEVFKLIDHISSQVRVSKGLRKKYYQFRYDQLHIVKKIILDKNFELDLLKVRYQFLFAKLPNALKNLEGLSKTLAILFGSSMLIDSAIENYLIETQIDEGDIANIVGDIKVREPSEIISVEELLEEQFNSGDISFEEYLSASQLL